MYIAKCSFAMLCKFTLALYEFCLNENLVNNKKKEIKKNKKKKILFSKKKKKKCLSSKKKKIITKKIKLWQFYGIHAY